jgi:hypothetical protein
MLIFIENPVRSTVIILIYYVVQVFEANIRLLGGLLSAHLLMEDSNFPGLSPDWYLGMDDLPSVLHFKLIFIIKALLLIWIHWGSGKSAGQCCGSGSGRIRNFLQDPDPE